MIILVETPEIPLGAISVLSKGLGFVPTPTIDVMQTRLDMRRTINNIVSSSRRSSYSSNSSNEPLSDCSDDSKQLIDEAGFKLPSKLKKKNYTIPTPCDDKAVNDIVQSMESELDQILHTSGRYRTLYPLNNRG